MKRSFHRSLNRYLVLVLLLAALPARAQYYSTGSDPCSFRWNRMQIGWYDLIYPVQQTLLAEKFGRVLQEIGPVTSTMPAKLRRLPMILHPYAAYSNGTSVLAPRRIELFPKQPVALETNDYIPQLAIHEVRHFAQMEKLNSGFTKWAGYLLGDQAMAIVLGIHVPKWLLEGDAVLTETLLSDAGRGRIANFIQPLRSRLIAGTDLSYDRIMQGTYQDVLPNEYLFGYFLTARGRMLSDPMLWSDALGEIGRNPFHFNGISGMTQPRTGYRFSKLLVETLDWLHKYWTDPKRLDKVPEKMVTLVEDTTLYQNYFRPQRMEDGSVICLKKSIVNLPAFVAIDSTGQERVLTRPGQIEDAGFSYRDGKIVWAELIQDPRWENRSWSELYLFDTRNNRKSRLTHGERYFSPEFNRLGNRIAVISEEPDGASSVRILDAADGHALTTVLAGKNQHFSYLCWGNTPDELWAITTSQRGRQLVRVIMNGLPPDIYFDGGQLDITCPVHHKDWIYFCGPSGATQGVYRMNRMTGRTEWLFGHPHGVNYLTVSNGELLMSVYSAEGYRPAAIPIEGLNGKPVTTIHPIDEPVTNIIQRGAEEFPVDFEMDRGQFKPTRYSKLANLFRFHSWSPIYIDPDAYQISPGIVLMTQNDLSTLTGWTGYQWNKTDHSSNLMATLRYSGLYPEIDFDFKRKYLNDKESGFQGFRQSIKLTTGIPLNFSSGAWGRRIQPGILFEQISSNGRTEGVRERLAIQMAGVSLYTAIARNLSYRDLFPKWGFSLRCSYFKSFADRDMKDNLTGRLMLYLPGGFPNSSVRILNSANILNSDQYFNAIQDFPRGQEVKSARSSYNFKIDYALPLSYPDYHVSWLIYVKRIRADFFFDAGTPLEEIKWFMSTGADLMFDYNLLRIGINLESGLRMMYFPTKGRFGVEFLYSFSVN